MRKIRIGITSGLVLLGAASCGDASSEGDVVARVGDYALTVDEAVQLLVDEEQLATDTRVVGSLAELWIDYTLLADAAARDTMFPDLDLEPLVMQQLSQSMVFQLRDSVIQVDTFVTETELRVRYEEEAPAVDIRARHIMLQLPLQATPSQRDSVRARLQEIRARALAGESFAALANQFSQDPGTAANGGDLGYFQRGDMVAPFEQAALALEPGQVSDVVETPMGMHVIRLEDRRVQTFEDVSGTFRRQVQGRMVQEAESVFVSGLVDRAAPEVVDGAAEIVREMAANPGTRLSGRAGRRALIEWERGAVTVGELQQILRMETPAVRAQIAESTDEEVDDFLASLARRELLVAEAEVNGLRPARDSIDSLVANAKQQLRGAARMLGLLEVERAPGEDVDVAVSRAVEEALEDNLSGATQVVPLGLVSFQLREGRSSTVRDAGIGRVIVDVAEIRTTRRLSPAEESIDSSLTRPDSVGR